MQEIWKDIVGYEGVYQISNFGNVRSLKYWSNIHKKYYDRIKILKKRNNNLGYEVINLSKFGIKKYYTIHRLVAKAFIPNPNNYKEINHIDGNKRNNYVDNLEWCTRSQNMLHAYNKGLKKGISKYNKKVLQILDGKIIKIWNNISEIKNTLHLDYSSIFQCCNKKRNKCGGYKWEYAKEER